MDIDIGAFGVMNVILAAIRLRISGHVDFSVKFSETFFLHSEKMCYNMKETI